MVDRQSQQALLPDGLRDNLPPDAGHEAGILDKLLATFAASGYDRVDPPLVEFEESLLAGAGAALKRNTFRLMDPASKRMMGLRADMTPQIARIAVDRLGKSPRPLRLFYSGYVLRVGGSQLTPERQFRQAGVELIGAEESAADAEVILLAHDAMIAAGAGELSVDLNLPTLVPALCEAHGIGADQRARLRTALDRKDVAEIAALGGDAAVALSALMQASGPAPGALAALREHAGGAETAAECARLDEVLARLEAEAPALAVTVDLVENRGFEYHTGLAFTFFARGVRGELGRGGRYEAAGEMATGFSLFLHNLIGAVPLPAPERRIFLPPGTDSGVARQLRADGWITVAGLAEVGKMAIEARRFGCSHYFDGKAPAAAGKDGEDR